MGDYTFSYRASQNGLVQIFYQGRVVTRLSGRQGEKFLQRVESDGGANAQLVMAKATGHFKHGNERSGKS